MTFATNALALRTLLANGCSAGRCDLYGTVHGQHTNSGCRCIARLAELALEVAADADAARGRHRFDPPLMGERKGGGA